MSAGKFRIDPARSVVRFAAAHVFGLGPVQGTLAVVDGEVVVAEDRVASTAWAVLDAASFTTDKPRRDADVRGRRFLDVANHPTMRFESISLVPAADGGWLVDGELTVHGQTRPITVTVHAARPVDGGLVVRASGAVDRYDFGVTAGRGLIGRRLTVSIDLHAVS